MALGRYNVLGEDTNWQIPRLENVSIPVDHFSFRIFLEKKKRNLEVVDIKNIPQSPRSAKSHRDNGSRIEILQGLQSPRK